MGRVKRTYNLSEHTVMAVRELAAEYHVAPTQDAVVELAVDELARRVREAGETALWSAAATDPDFQQEAADVEAAYRSADRATWPRA